MKSNQYNRKNGKPYTPLGDGRWSAHGNSATLSRFTPVLTLRDTLKRNASGLGRCVRDSL